MATSGTYTFGLGSVPSIGEVMLYSFSMIGIRRTQMVAEHMTDARMAMNMMLAEWGNDTPNLWTIDLVTQTLVAGVATYNVDPQTIMILDAYIRTGSGDQVNDRIIWPISRTEYASMPNKDMQAQPTTFWFDRLLNPTITLWQVPDDQQTYELRYYRCRQIEDADVQNGQTAAIPSRWLPAFAWGLAARLAVSYAPDKAVALDAKAEASLKLAQKQDVENVNLQVFPALGGYFVR